MIDLNNYKQSRIIEIKQNEYLNNFISLNNLSNSFIMDNFSVFDLALSSLKKCKKCKGLENCTQTKKGEILGVSLDPILANDISYCDYYKVEVLKNNLIKSYIYSDIPESLYSLSLKNITINEEQLKALFIGVYQLYEGKRNKGFYIYGDLGVGKTYMCIALANSLALKGKKVAFIKTNNFVTEMANLNRTDGDKFLSVLNSIKKADYVFLDDIGSEIVTEFVRDRLLIDLLDYRMENKLCTIFTSNLDKASLLKHYGNNSESIKAKRLLERIDILSEDFCLTGLNKRRIDND